MKKHKAKIWLSGYFILVIGMLSIVAYWTVKVDPFFHYHKPDIDKYFYVLDNQRSQNDGILKNFDYNAIIIGTSMTENFKTSEMDKIFDTNSIKVPFAGGRYKEINDNVAVGLSHNSKLKTIVRGLDMDFFIIDKDMKKNGEYPIYLYDENLFNDVKYIFNRDVFFKRVYPMITERNADSFKPGITSFDTYSNWMEGVTFGIKTVCPDGVATSKAALPVYLSDEERNTVLGTIQQNIVSLAKSYPNVTFYYFFTPYSAVWWEGLVSDGTIYKQIEAEQLIIEEILKYDNIKLYSFNNLFNITTDLNNYKDAIHYGEWVNSLMLRFMKDEKCLLTYENYQDYLNSELSFYLSYDYSQLNNQVDYDNDAKVILDYKINGIEH